MKCKLCLKESDLCNSHIIPEFLYKSVYDEKNRMLMISDNSETSNIPYQKGLRERLLCKNCESKLSKYEKYAKESMYGGIVIKVRKVNFGLEIIVDYKSFKIFQMSILWRASISSHDFFANVSLGYPHEERMRKMIYEENPGRQYEYGCLVITSFKYIEKIQKFITMPEKFHYMGHWAYRFVMGGVLWIYFVSSHSKKLPHNEIFLTENGLFRVFNNQSRVIPFIKDVFIKLHSEKREGGPAK